MDNLKRKQMTFYILTALCFLCFLVSRLLVMRIPMRITIEGIDSVNMEYFILHWISAISVLIGVILQYFSDKFGIYRKTTRNKTLIYGTVLLIAIEMFRILNFMK